MAREPVKPPRLTIATPIKPGLLKNPEVIKPKPNEKVPDLRLAEVVAALRRELESVALIAASDDREVPRFHVSEVEMDFAYAVSSVEDVGVRVVINRDSLTDLPDTQLHRMKLKLVDADVMQLTQAGPKS